MSNSAELNSFVEQLIRACTGDVQVLIEQVRARFALNDAQLADAFEQAGIRFAAAQDRYGAWWSACSLALVRKTEWSSAQEEAELHSARWFGELSNSNTAKSPIPQAARWLVAGQATAPPTPQSLELARRNATTYLDRAEAELTGRIPLFAAKAEATSRAPETLEAIEKAIASYEKSGQSTLLALVRVTDHLMSQTGDAAFLQNAKAAVREIADGSIPALLKRTLEARKNALHVHVDAPSQVPSPAVPVPAKHSMPPTPTVPEPTLDELEAAMRSAFETAWQTPSQENRAAFERTVRARYAREVASIADPETRSQTLEHYVSQSLGQLPGN